MTSRGTLVYVHGAGDRREQLEDHVSRIEAQLSAAGLPLDVLPARWGEEAGARLDRIEDALPLTQPISAAQLQRLLTVEPLAELEQLAGRPGPLNQPATLLEDAARWREADQLLEICRTEVGAPGELVQRAGGGAEQLSVACRVAAERVATSDEYARAHEAAVPEAELVAAAGRAVAASVAADAAAPASVLGSVQVRIAEAVLGAAAATLFAGYLGIDVGPSLKRWATDVLLPHRARLMRDAGLGPADILLYLRSGSAIRQSVAAAIALARERGGPVVALGNSLGGIVLVNLLAQPWATKPDLLVTVGSQAPLLASIGALELPDMASQPPQTEPFQPWLNIYDRRDLLGFAASRVWPEAAGVLDREVDMGLGFPDSHGVSYLSHAGVYRHIRDHPALAGPAVGSPTADQPPKRRFPIRLGPRSRPLLRLFFGVTQQNAYVELNTVLDARFGWFRLQTPLANVESWRIEGRWLWITAIGIRRSLLRGDVTFGGNHHGGVRLTFREPVRWLVFRVPALYVTVEDMEGLGAALAELGIPGADARAEPNGG